MNKYRVGLKDEHWCLITDGTSVYMSEDVRYNHTPPHLPSRETPSVCDEETYRWITDCDIDAAFSEASDTRKRIFKLSVSQSDIERYCKLNGNYIKEATLGLKSWFSPFSESEIAAVFLRVERDYNGWVEVDKQLYEIKQDREKSYN